MREYCRRRFLMFILSFLENLAVGFTELVTTVSKEFITAPAVSCQSRFAQNFSTCARCFANVLWRKLKREAKRARRVKRAKILFFALFAFLALFASLAALL